MRIIKPCGGGGDSGSGSAWFALLVVLIFFASLGVYPYIGVTISLWLGDFEDWADEIDSIVTDTTIICTNESDLYDLVDSIETFFYIAYAFTAISIYYFLSICGGCCSSVFEWETCEICCKQSCLVLNYLLQNGCVIVFIWQYLTLTELLSSVNEDSTTCGPTNSSILSESETYLNKLEAIPLQYILYIYIAQFTSCCCMTYLGVKLMNKEEKETETQTAATISRAPHTGATGSAERAVVPASRSGYSNQGAYGYGSGRAGAAAATAGDTTGSRELAIRTHRPAPQRSASPPGGRDRTDSEQKLAVLVSALAVTMYGFEFATQKNCDDAVRKLNSIECSSRTALRDAIYLGFARMVKLKDHLMEIDAFDHNFIHIVLTDGADTSSKISKMEFLAFQHVLDQKNFHEICKTIFIGVGLDYEAERDLKAYTALGGDHSHFENCDTMDIEKVFNHISLNLIQRTRVAAFETEHGRFMIGSQERGVAVELNHFLVLLTLDISGSMAGGRWRAVKRAVKGLLDNLKSSDIFGIVLFNDEIKSITGADS